MEEEEEEETRKLISTQDKDGDGDDDLSGWIDEREEMTEEELEDLDESLLLVHGMLLNVGTTFFC